MSGQPLTKMVGRGLTLVVQLSVYHLNFPLVQLVGVRSGLSRRVLKVVLLLLAAIAVGVGRRVYSGHCIGSVQRRLAGVLSIDHYLPLMPVVELDVTIRYRDVLGRRRAESSVRQLVSGRAGRRPVFMGSSVV